jgi:transcriptional regulator with XRE-family HTH domain
MVLIHEKITALLEQRRLKKRDLARALGVSPQTATDICKGRSAITLPHLRNLISFFEVRAEFWLDHDRLAPEEIDRLSRRGAADALSRSGMLDIEDPERLMQRLRGFAQTQRDSFLSAFPDLTAAEQRLFGLSDPAHGSVGQISGSDMEALHTESGAQPDSPATDSESASQLMGES